MMDKNDVLDIAEILAIIITCFILIIIMPFIHYWIGYFTGWLAMKVIGVPLITAINETFGTSFVPSMLPKICATLYFIGGFFRTSSVKSLRKGDSRYE